MTGASIPILIVGGGGAGLTASATLSRLCVESLLVSALPTTSILPKAHRDPRCAWLRQREISEKGAVLVRPDRVVTWRSIGAASNPIAVFAQALSNILGRV